MAHYYRTLLAKGKAGNRDAGRLPEKHLALAWSVSFLVFVLWLHKSMDRTDFAVFVGIHLVCLPLIFPWTTPRFVSWLSGPIIGVIAGMQAIDLCFDFIIYRGLNLSDGEQHFEARRVAYLYYKTILNSSHVNGALLAIVLCATLGVLIGLGRSLPHARRLWLLTMLVMTPGICGYLLVVVPRYLHIRESAQYNPAFFNAWGEVIAARMVLYGSIVACLGTMFSFQSLVQNQTTQEFGIAKRLF